MNKETKQLLREMVQSWWSNPLPIVLPREVDLMNFFDPKIKKIISVVGFRRSGKTFTMLGFAKKYGQNNCVYLNFEDERFPKKTEVLTSLVEVLRELRGNDPLVLLLDEIQEIPNWSLWARRVNETTSYRLIISGSSSKLSSQEIPTELRGQTLTVTVFPLSWQEYLAFQQQKITELPNDKILYFLRDYLKFGGLPEIVLAKEGLKPFLLDEYYQTFVQRDVVERNKIRNKEALRALLKIALNSRTFTYSNFANTLKSLGFKIGKATVINYLAAVNKGYFLFPVEVGGPNIKRRLQAAKKLYSVDTFFSFRYASAFSQNIGHLMEQSVYLEFLRQRAQDATKEIFYWKDYVNHEVDFLITKNSEITNLYQVTFAENEAEIIPRETDSLLRAAKQLHCENLTIVTWNLEMEKIIGELKIKFIPLWRFLLSQSKEKQ